MDLVTKKDTATINNQYKVIFENSPLGIFYYTKDGKIAEYNKKFADIIGANDKELYGINLFDIISNYTVLDIFKKSLKQDTCIYLGDYHSAITGKKLYIRLNINRVCDDNGDVAGAVVIFEDLTSHREREERLKVSEANYRNMLDNAGDMILVITDGRAVYVNDELVKRSGYTRKEFNSNSFFQFVHPEDIAALQTNYLSRQAGKPLADNYLIRAITKRGEERTVEVNVQETLYDSNPSIIVIMRDITEKLLMENQLVDAKNRAEESEQVKATFLSTMSHELRTPLNHVIGFSNLLEDEDINENAKAYSKMIYKSGIKLLSIIEDVYTFIGLEQGEEPVYYRGTNVFEVFNINKCCLHKILDVSQKADSVKLMFRPDPRFFDISFKVDVHKVNMVLKNIFKNAVKFTDVGSIEFGYTVSLENELIFYVSDMGIGISESNRDVIFDFFRQADEKTTRNYGGVGLGLALSKKMAESLKGEISFRNNDNGIGTTFYFKLPMEISE